MGLLIAISVAAIICTVSLPIFSISNLASARMLFIVAVFVGMLIVVGILSNKYEYLKTKHIVLKPSDLEEVKTKKEKFKTTFTMMIAGGVFIIIAAIAFVTIFDSDENIYDGYFLLAVAFAVFMFIIAGIKNGLYR